MQMLQQILGEQGGRYAAFLLTAIALVIAILVIWVLIRKALGSRLNLSDKPDRRGRPPRLGITESFNVDRDGRRLVMVRRDNVEHLLMIGGPNDVVIETNVLRGERPIVLRGDNRMPEADLIPTVIPSAAVSPSPTAAAPTSQSLSAPASTYPTAAATALVPDNSLLAPLPRQVLTPVASASPASAKPLTSSIRDEAKLPPLRDTRALEPASSRQEFRPSMTMPSAAVSDSVQREKPVPLLQTAVVPAPPSVPAQPSVTAQPSVSASPETNSKSVAEKARMIAKSILPESTVSPVKSELSAKTDDSTRYQEPAKSKPSLSERLKAGLPFGNKPTKKPDLENMMEAPAQVAVSGMDALKAELPKLDLAGLANPARQENPARPANPASPAGVVIPTSSAPLVASRDFATAPPAPSQMAVQPTPSRIGTMSASENTRFAPMLKEASPVREPAAVTPSEAARPGVLSSAPAVVSQASVPAPVVPAPVTPAPVAPVPPPPAAAARPQSRNPFDSLEEEMAKLLGRAPEGKG